MSKLYDVIKDSQIFSELTQEALKYLAHHSEFKTLHKDEILFKQGSPSDYVYIVHRGELLCYTEGENDEQKYINAIYPQEIIGELSALSNKPRSLTLIAAQSTSLVAIPRNCFVTICQSFPNVLLHIITSLISRSQKMVSLVGGINKAKLIYLLPISNKINVDDLTEMLSPCLKNGIILKDSTKTRTNFRKNLFKMEDKYALIIMNKMLDPEHIMDLTRDKKGKIYFVADATDTSYYIDPKVKLLIQDIQKNILDKSHLILIHPADTTLPSNTRIWLDQCDFGQHYHIRKGNRQDAERLIRFFNEKAVGLVLSGGGTRILADAGVIKAIHDKKIIIDAAGGASGGGIMAIGFLLFNLKQFLENFYYGQHAAYRTFSYHDLTWPIISIYSGKTLTRALQNLYGDLYIEDLWLPYFCVSANLNQFKQYIHTRGKIWEALRATISVPGIIAPMVFDGNMHFDGGLINNLPVDVMKSIIGLQSFIIAVLLTRSSERYKADYRFPPILTLRETLLYKLHLIKRDYVFPSLGEVFLNALSFGAHDAQNKNAALADILINPNLNEYSLLGRYNKKQEETIFEIGYNEAIKVFKENKKLLEKIYEDSK